jgi:hypothetical protein
MIPPVWIFSLVLAANKERQSFAWHSTPERLQSLALARRLRVPLERCAKCGGANATLGTEKVLLPYGSKMSVEIELCNRCRTRSRLAINFVRWLPWLFLVSGLVAPVLGLLWFGFLILLPAALVSYVLSRRWRLRPAVFRRDGVVMTVPELGRQSYLRVR